MNNSSTTKTCCYDEIVYNLYFERPAVEFYKDILKFINENSRNYIWNYDRFSLEEPSTSSSSLVLSGKTNVGESIEDEWFITHILFKLSKLYHHVGLVISVTDSDGQFLCIEAAVAGLPSWVTPETTTVSSNRVFIYNGNLHLVEHDLDNATLDLHKVALPYVRKEYKTIGSEAIQNALKARMNRAVDFATVNHHTIRVVVPLGVAKVLQVVPESIGRAVHAFYYREPTEAFAVASRMKNFPTTAQSESLMVHTMATLSRCMYGQLRQQQVAHPPKPFEDCVNLKKDDSHAFDIGMKLSIGLELFVTSNNCIITEKIQQINNARVTRVEEFPRTATWGDDDSDWLEVPPESLEQMLHEAANRKTTTLQSDKDHLNDISKMMENFVTTVSSHEGVEKDFYSSDDDSSSDDEIISFDMAKLERILLSSADQNKKNNQNVNVEEEMEREIQESTLGQSFSHEAVSSLEDDLDYNLVSNLIDSIASQGGEAGPVSNLLNELGFKN